MLIEIQYCKVCCLSKEYSNKIKTDKMEIKMYDSYPQPEDSFLQLMEKANVLFTPPFLMGLI